MRKSTRIASNLIHSTAKSSPKRARESIPSISEVEHEQSSADRKPAKKRAKREAKPAQTDNKTKVKTSLPRVKTEKKATPTVKSREVAKKIKKEKDEVAQDQKVETSSTSKVTSLNSSSSNNTIKVESKKFIGAHVSISGSLSNAVYEAVEIGAKAFAMFLRSQRQWKSKPLDENVAQKFREACVSHGFSSSHILPHGIYLMNCGSPEDETLAKSREVLVEELQRCEMLGLTLYNFHPGSTCGKISVDACLDKIAESINIAHSKTASVITVIENMSCQGNTIGGKFEELRGIIDRVQDKSRIGVCLDTCHSFAAGYDISNQNGYDKVMNDFESIVGFQYLKGVHLNDSKGDLGCHLDRHENIGKGKISKEGFRLFMEDKRFDGIPMILETPCVSDDTYKNEIKTLYSMVL